ncbi:MAG: DUF262 domain-containing protein [Ardenticatenaceae bacterium]|nr:DUF262 domain-containing protein [Ardenticatenaceae bacterium]
MSNQINPGNPEDFLEIEVDESQEDEGLVSYDIATYPSDFTLSGIVNMWQNGDITIPDFQREFVWTIRQASLLIESFLLGLPVPPVFFYIDDENRNLVVDGQQRILSTAFFFEGYFGVESIQGRRQVFRLMGLDERSPYYKKQFNELSDSDQRKLRNTVLRAINIRQLAPSGENTSVYHIFERLNTGGTPLKPQEIRNVVFRGDLVSILRVLNHDDNWRVILGKKTFDKHQTDVELVLRTFALSSRAFVYEKPMKEFMNKAMKRHRHGNTANVRKFQKVFPAATKIIVEALGEKPFHLRGRLNTSALDSVFCTIMDNFDKLPRNLSERYQALIKDSTFEELTTIGTTDTLTVKKRFELVKSYLLED